jgi:hypothetical protein
MNEYKKDFEIFRCHFNAEDSHFYTQPKVLPCCSKLACEECILNSLANGYLKCSYCNKINTIHNVNNLTTNNSLIDQMNSQSNDILTNIEQNIINYSNESKGNNSYLNYFKIIIFYKNLKKKKDKNNKLIEEMCNKAINSIDSRISTVENHLETLQTELMASLTSIKQKSNEEFNKLNSQVKIKTELNDLFLNEMKQKLDETTTTNTSVDKLFELQACINSINELESFYRVLNRKIRYESSDWMPNDSFICSFFEIFKENK